MNTMAEQNGNLPEVISPSDEDTSDLEEFLEFLFQNQVTQVTKVDESSNSSTAQYMELVSLTNKEAMWLYAELFLGIWNVQKCQNVQILKLLGVLCRNK